MFSIGDLSRRTGVKVPTIRYYEQMGLVAAPERSEGNQRRYGRQELERLAFIRHARDLGFAVEDIRSLIEWAATEQPCVCRPDRRTADFRAGGKIAAEAAGGRTRTHRLFAGQQDGRRLLRHPRLSRPRCARR